jgi:hypothetical protein
LENNACTSTIAVSVGLLQASLGKSKRIQLVSTSDIGWFAARALENPADFAGRAIALAGDELSIDEICATYFAVTGQAPRPFPTPRFGLQLLPKELFRMLRWFAEHGFQADVLALKREHLGLLSFESWLQTAHWRPASTIHNMGCVFELHDQWTTFTKSAFRSTRRCLSRSGTSSQMQTQVPIGQNSA